MEKLDWVIAAPVGGEHEMFSAASLIGTLDGANKVFTLVPAPRNGVQLFLNSQLLNQGTQPNGQYTVSGAVVTFQPQAVPQPDMILQAFVW